MHLMSYRKLITLAVLLLFLVGVGCATTESYKPPMRPKTDPYIIQLEDESAKTYIAAPLEKGQSAPEDGVWFDKESAKRLLEMKERYKGLRSEVEIQNEISKGRAAQIDLLYEANDLQKAANVELVQEIERNKKWAKWEKWGSFFGGIALMVGSKFVWD